MENLLIDTDSFYKRVSVVKTKFPDYHLYRANGIPLPPLPYSLTLDVSEKRTVSQLYRYYEVGRTPPPYSVRAEQAQAWWSDDRNDINNVLAGWNSFLVEADKDVTNDLLSKIKGQSISIGLMYAERHQTGALVLSTLDRFVKAIKCIRHPKLLFRQLFGRKPNRRELRKLRSTARYVSSKANTVGDAWMAYRYAWTPLVLDVRDSLEALANQKRKMYRHSAKASWKGEYEGPWRDSALMAFPADCRTRVTGFYGTHIKCFYDVENPLATAWTSLADPLAQVWDFIPFSFVLDWFVDVSQALDLRSATWGTKFTAGYKSSMKYRVIENSSYYWSETYWFNWLKIREYLSGTLPADRLTITVDRSVLSDFPDVQLRFPLEEGLNVSRIMDTIALLNRRLSQKL